jgi:hopanoid biosynthesis associated protein HpnK
MTSVIINADDFGLSSGVNRAVINAWREGILTSASLMAAGDAFDEAVTLARQNPGLQVGLHLTLVQGRAVLNPAEIPGLVDQSGSFTDNPVAAGMRYFFLKGLRSQLRCEIEAQLGKVRDAGIPLSHVDGHLNIQMQPVVFDILMELAPRYGITSFRLTRERLTPSLRADGERTMGKRVDAFIFDRLAARSRPYLDRLGIGYTVEVKGLLNSGRMTEEYLLGLMDDLQPGTTEIYFHPGCLPCAEITRRMPEYRHEEELAALTSPRVARKLKDLGIRLRNYRGEEKTVC